MTETVKTEPKFDIVQKAQHYNEHPKGFECIDIIEDAPTGLLFNAGKYFWRVCWGNKGGLAEKIQDLEKAIWYLQRQIVNWKAVLEAQQKAAGK